MDNDMFDKFKNMQLPNIQLPKIDLGVLEMKHNLNLDFIERQSEIQNDILRINQEKHQREVENNESLKSLVEYNYEISNYNKELVSLNEKILNKINSLDDALLFLNKAFDKKSYSDKTLAQEHNALLLELILIIESKDSSKLKQFLSGIAAPVGVGLVVEYLKMQLGLSGM